MMLKPQQHCPIGACAKIISRAWALEIIYHLSVKPHFYGELRRVLQSISPKVLTTRLKEFEHEGIVKRIVYPSKPPKVEYRLGPVGKDLIPVFASMTDVGKKLLKRQTK